MRRLEEILRTIDNKERLTALLAYARLLDVDVDMARNEEGELIENRLIILIYDGEEARKFRRNKNIGAWAGSLFLSCAIFVAMWLIYIILLK